MSDPIILTAWFGDDAQERFDALREEWFPPRLNMIPAHLTLFHKLPGEKEAEIKRELERLCAGRAPFCAEVSEVVSLGSGTALKVVSPRLKELRGDIARAFEADLTAQDAQGFRPHVTVQNKVTSKTAKACRTLIRDAFSAFGAEVLGVRLYRYKGGPWEDAGAVALGG